MRPGPRENDRQRGVQKVEKPGDVDAQDEDDHAGRIADRQPFERRPFGRPWTADAEQAGLFTLHAGELRSAGQPSLAVSAGTLVWFEPAPRAALCFVTNENTNAAPAWWLRYQSSPA